MFFDISSLTQPGAHPNYVNVKNINMRREMDITAKIDEHGKGAWIAIMVLGFIVFWPIGLAILAFMIWSGRMGGKKRGNIGRWHYEYKEDANGTGPCYRRRTGKGRRRATENWAFEEYREETLRRLEEEQAEFEEFLDRLRHAEDKAQFDKFMDERRSRPAEDDVVDVEAEDVTANKRPDAGGPQPQPSA